MRGKLDAIAARAAAQLRASRGSAALAEAVEWAMPVLLAVPALVLLYHLCGGHLPPWLAVGLTLLPFAAAVSSQAYPAFCAAVPHADALCRVDRELELEDRLSAADEFLKHPAPTGFMKAAVEDAERFLASALAVELAVRRPARPRGWLYPAGGAVLLLLAMRMEPEAASRTRAAVAESAAARTDASGPRAREEERVEPDQRRPEPRRRGVRAASEAARTRADRYSSDETEATRGTDAMSRSGQSAEGGAPTRSADSRGAPSALGQSAEGDRRKKETDARKRTSRKQVAARTSRRQVPDKKSGATTGRTAASSSSRNPTASDWASKDKVPDGEDDPIEDDEEVEDEESDSDARGGMQPNLRDRKPPVSRDLSIGFGNRPNPNANGRGGPSQRKKSRGTASLVLGVPIPDHVKGNPNPGQTKVTQERVEPKREKSEPARAGARRARKDPFGHLARPELEPWMRELLRHYFLSIRETRK